MRRLLVLITTTLGLALLFAASDVDSGKSAAAAQRVTVTYTGVGTVRSRGTFRLQAGNLSDAGRAADSITEESAGQRAGQSFIDVTFSLALKGRRGTLVIRWTGRYVSAGDTWEVVTGTWWIEKGTGEYAGAQGMGRIAGVFTARGNRYFQRLQGTLTLS
jgi:hypothetical protein